MTRKIRIKINEDGSMQVNNAGNPDERRILTELSELAEMLNGSPKGFEVERHVHTHQTAHVHSDGHVHSHG
jgi:hypothetical protein